MRVEIYRNLHNGKLSIRDAKTKHVVGHADSVHLHYVHFKVSQAGRERVLREKKKNVHAVAIGTLGRVDGFTSFKGRDIDSYLYKYSLVKQGVDLSDTEVVYDVTYNPYKYNQFWRVDKDEPVMGAGFVHIVPERISVIRMTYEIRSYHGN